MKTLNTLFKSFSILILIVSIISCEKESDLTLEEIISDNSKEEFDFENFGRAHNAYLEYVWDFENNYNPEARFNYGKTYVDPIFGSFDTGLTWKELNRQMPMHIERVNAILEGKYNAQQENLSPVMTNFLNRLAKIVKASVDNKTSINDFKLELSDLENDVQLKEEIIININTGMSNDGAAMLAITSILKYSTDYWINFDRANSSDGNGNGGGNSGDLPLAKGKIWRALADAWGYVSAWVDNGDGSYSWDHESALVNADCVSDKVREN